MRGASCSGAGAAGRPAPHLFEGGPLAAPRAQSSPGTLLGERHREGAVTTACEVLDLHGNKTISPAPSRFTGRLNHTAAELNRDLSCGGGRNRKPRNVFKTKHQPPPVTTGCQKSHPCPCHRRVLCMKPPTYWSTAQSTACPSWAPPLRNTPHVTGAVPGPQHHRVLPPSCKARCFWVGGAWSEQRTQVQASLVKHTPSQCQTRWTVGKEAPH